MSEVFGSAGFSLWVLFRTRS